MASTKSCQKKSKQRGDNTNVCTQQGGSPPLTLPRPPGTEECHIFLFQSAPQKHNARPSWHAVLINTDTTNLKTSGPAIFSQMINAEMTETVSIIHSLPPSHFLLDKLLSSSYSGLPSRPICSPDFHTCSSNAPIIYSQSISPALPSADLAWRKCVRIRGVCVCVCVCACVFHL